MEVLNHEDGTDAAAVKTVRNECQRRSADDFFRSQVAMMPSSKLDKLLVGIRACQICAVHLALGPRAVVQVSATARLLIVNQAPDRKVHLSGIPCNDVSGDRLRK